MNSPNELPNGLPQEQSPLSSQPAKDSAEKSAFIPLGLEEALGRLEAIVRVLEEGQPSLDESLAQYEEGVRLLRHCYQLLEKAERRIEMLSGVDAQGNPIVQPFDDRPLSLEEKAQSRDLRRTARHSSSTPSKGEEDSLPGSGGLF